MLTRRDFLKGLTLGGLLYFLKHLEVIEFPRFSPQKDSYNFSPRKKGKIFKFQPPMETVFHLKTFNGEDFIGSHERV